MDDKTQRERLEQELRFLKESFEAEVISKEEFEKGKDRVEKKLKEIQNSATTEEQKIEEPAKQENAETIKSDETIQAKEPDKIKLKVIQDEPIETSIEAQKVEQKETPQTAPEKKAYAEEKKDKKFFKYTIIVAVLILIIYFSFSFFKGNETEKTEEENTEIKFAVACNSGADCKQEGKIGFCLQPGTVNAKCEFKYIQKINVLVVNDRKNCFNCDTQRVLNILESWFGAINVKEIDYNTNEGKGIAEKFNVGLLPLYVLDENITTKQNFEQFKQAFVKKDGIYVLSEDAAASTFYFRRNNVPNRLDLFVKENDDASIKAENNIKEFLAAFQDVEFNKYTSNDELTKELSIKTFPTFLVNNQVRFSGIHTADTIKNNFCKLNKLPECEKSLSKSLI